MGKRDPRVNTYIAKSADFAKPILKHIREVVHEGCPEVEEMKWGMPHFEYEGILCGMGSFREHCALHVWKGSLIVGDRSREAMGQFGRITRISDLPSEKILAGYIKQAMKLREDGVKNPARSKRRKEAALVVPSELTSALNKNKKAAAAFKEFPPSHKREYADWISEAKREDTRKRRADTAVEWVAEGKSRNWNYEKRQ